MSFVAVEVCFFRTVLGPKDLTFHVLRTTSWGNIRYIRFPTYHVPQPVCPDWRDPIEIVM